MTPMARLRSLSVIIGVALVGACTDENEARVSPPPVPEPPIDNTALVPPGTPAPRHIVLIMLDDADHRDFGFNSTDAITPTIDLVRNSGAYFSRYYSAGAICSPTRVSLLTGRLPIYFGLNRNWPNVAPDQAGAQRKIGLRSFPRDMPTIAALSQAGYTSAHFGKWHVGMSRQAFLPEARGYSHYVVDGNGSSSIIDNGVAREESSAWRPGYTADRILQHLQDSPAESRHFIHWWTQVPHFPLAVPPHFDNSCCGFDLATERGKLLAMMHAFDAEIARVLAFFEAQGTLDDTLILITSDNGGQQTVLAEDRLHRGAKNNLLEGGIRVPLVASWPRAIAAGGESSTVASSIDLMPSLFHVVGLQPPQGVHGHNVFGPVIGPERALLWQHKWWNKREGHSERDAYSYAVIQGCEKLIKLFGRPRLFYYDVCADPGETLNLATDRPERFDTLRSLLMSERQRLSAIPIPAETHNATVAVAGDERSNAHHDDLSFMAQVVLPSEVGTYNVFSRGEAMQLRIRVSAPGALRAQLRISGVDESGQETDRVLAGTIPAAAATTELGFVMAGYMRDHTTIELYADGQRIGRLQGPDSVYALISEEANIRLGAPGLSLRNARLHSIALWPAELE